MDYLYDSNEEVFSNSNTLEYLLYRFVCFDLEKLIQIYKDDEKMLQVMATLKALKENAYTLEYNPIKISVWNYIDYEKIFRSLFYFYCDITRVLYFKAIKNIVKPFIWLGKTIFLIEILISYILYYYI